jgi:hypothetical protein
VADADIISAFWSGRTCRTLVHELRQDQSSTTKELFDIAIRHASGEEAIGAAFILGNAKVAAYDSHVAPPKVTTKGAKKGAKSSKRGLKWHP